MSYIGKVNALFFCIENFDDFVYRDAKNVCMRVYLTPSFCREFHFLLGERIGRRKSKQEKEDIFGG